MNKDYKMYFSMSTFEFEWEIRIFRLIFLMFSRLQQPPAPEFHAQVKVRLTKKQTNKGYKNKLVARHSTEEPIKAGFFYVVYESQANQKWLDTT